MSIIINDKNEEKKKTNQILGQQKQQVLTFGSFSFINGF